MKGTLASLRDRLAVPRRHRRNLVLDLYGEVHGVDAAADGGRVDDESRGD